MPKIIENLQEKLIAEAKRQIEEGGYTAMTIRSVASGCGVGVGTVYNYFESKEELAAVYLLQDWNTCIAAIESVSAEAAEPRAVVRCICSQLDSYADRHDMLFRDASAAAAFAGSFSRYHTLLRAQLAGPLRRFCESDFAAEFIAESLLTWTMAGTPFDDLWAMLEKLL